MAAVNGYYTFNAQIYISLATGSPTGIDRQLKLAKNGVPFSRTVAQSSDATGGMSISVTGSIALAAGDQVTAVIYVTTTGASTWDIDNDDTTTYFEGNRNNS